VRAHPLASLIWLLFTAMLAVLPPHAASGEALTWKQLPDREELTFRFESHLPTAEPRQRGLTQVLIAIPPSFWQRERQPKIPNFSRAKLIKNVSVTADGVFIQTRSDDFLFSDTPDPKRKTLTIAFYLPPKEPEPAPAVKNATTPGQNSTSPGAFNATQAMPGTSNATGSMNASRTDGNATSPHALNASVADNATQSLAKTALQETAPNASAVATNATRPQPPESSRSSALRAKISRPEQNASLQGPPGSGQPADFRVRMHVERNATAMDENATLPGNATKAAISAPEPAPMPTPVAGAANDTAAPRTASEQIEPVKIPPAAPRPARNASETPPPVGNLSEQVQDQASADVPAMDNATTLPSHAENSTTRDTHTAQGNASDPTHATLDNASETMNASAQGNATDDNGTAELESLYAKAQKAIMAGDMQGARKALDDMVKHPKVNDDLREELLYTLADIAMQVGKADLSGNFTDILDAYQTAMSANPNSSNVPAALASMAYLHLNVGNVPEAKGYFDLLRRKYPNDPRTSMIDVHWGEHYLRRKEYARAAEHFQYAIQNYPESKALLQSTVGLMKAFTELGFFDKAMELVDSIEKRWPGYYLSDPSFLMSAGYAASLSGSLDRARDYFWTYVNIVPQAPDADVAMARIGDIRVKQGRLDAAREIYHRTAEAYPDREGGLIAQMRLAEEGILDTPSLADMDLVFSRPESNPERIYQRILEHADSPLAPVARLKLAMWHLWGKKFAESLEDVRLFQRDYPEHELMPKVREVADKTIRDWILNDLEKEDFEAVVNHWQEHAQLFQDRDVEPQVRLAVATAFMKTGQLREALDTARPLVFGAVPRGSHSEPALDLTLAMLVDLQLWSGVVDLAQHVATWGLDPDRQRQVDYAAALAHEKLNQSALAKPLWTKLATDMNLTDTQRGYAHYFLGRAAMAANDMELATILGQEALSLLQKDKEDLGKLKESLELLIQAADRSGRPQEALAWSLEYDGYVAENDADWPAHTYRKALLFRKNGDMNRWREHMGKLKSLFPNTLHGRMAAAELEGVRLEKEAGQFR
jgi:tetratricopeptide (TPR) repeat protein